MEITKEMLLAARDYVPYAEKEAWVDKNGDKCFDRLSIKLGEDKMPPMYMVNSFVKARYLMAAFAKLYLLAEYEADEADKNLMSVADYDRWSESHALNQMERWKKDAEVRDKCYDLMADYKELEKHFSAKIAGFLSVQNDIVVRNAQFSQAQMQELPKLMEQLKELQQKKIGEDADGK